MHSDRKKNKLVMEHPVTNKGLRTSAPGRISVSRFQKNTLTYYEGTCSSYIPMSEMKAILWELFIDLYIGRPCANQKIIIAHNITAR